MAFCTAKTKIQIAKKSISRASDLASILGVLGCRNCNITSSIADLMAAMENNLPDLVFMDISLQGEIDALEAAEKIQKQWYIPVIFDTTSGDLERMKRADKTYPFRYITEPYDEKDIKISMEIALYAAEADRKRRKAEARLAHINRLLLAMHNIGQLIMAETDPKRLIEAVCSNITKQLDYFYALIVLFDESGRNPTMMAASGPPEQFEGMWDRLVQGDYPSCIDRVFAHEPPGLILTPQRDCPDCPYSNGHPERHAMAHKLVFDGRVYGIFTVSVPREHARDEEEQRLFCEMADDLAFALHKMEVGKALFRQTEKVNAAMRLGKMAWWEMKMPSGRIICDDDMIKMLDRDPADFQGAHYKAYTELLHPDDREASLDEARAHLAGHLPTFQMDYRIRKKDGSYIWVHSYGGVAERYEDGQPKRISGMVLNITQRKQAEEALKESEAINKRLNVLKERLLRPANLLQKLNLVTEAAVDIFHADFARIWIIKPGDRCHSGCLHAQVTEGPHVCRFREKCLHLVGSSGRYVHTDGDLHGRVPFGCYKIGQIASEKAPKYITNHVIDDPRVHDHEWAMKHGLVSFAGYRLLSAEDKPLGVMALFSQRPISDLDDTLLEGLANSTAHVIYGDKVHQALLESEAFAKSVIDSSPDCIKVVDHQGRLKYMSPGGQVLFEIDDITPLINLYYADLWQASPQVELIEQALKQAHQGLSGKVEAYLPTPKGTPKWWSITFNPIKAQDNPGDLLVVSRDITEAKMVEHQLQSAKEEAEAANLAKSHFLANMSHEIRTPMNAIIGFTELTMNELKDPVLKEYLALAYSSAQHLLAIINDILDISKIESGRNMLEKTVFDLDAHFNEVLGIQKKHAESKGLAFRYDISGDDFGLLEGDIGRLKQVLLNLVGNAIKFTEKGEILINVFLQKIEAQQVKLDVMVTDTGIGIPPEKAQVVFEPFSQAESSISRKYGGTGLGLAISRQLVEMMGGGLWLENRAEKGSTFGFTVPLNISPTQRPEDACRLPSDMDPSEKRSPLTSRLKILLAEDNLVNQKLVVSLLAKNGHDVTVAGNGNDALEALGRQSFDLVLMDVQMPEMDGLSATQAIREHEKRTGVHIPVIALTAHAMKGDRESFIAAGMDDYVAKPICKEELDRVIARVMNRHGFF